MGMSASQARFLSLTARKTNTEYEGQQINQQRTTLSNESSNYYSQLASMSVPTPPSTTDYTKMTYSFKDGTETNIITSLIAQENGVYVINYTQATVNDSVVSNGNVIINRTGVEGNYEYYAGGATKLRTLGVDSTDDPYLSTLDEKTKNDTLALEAQYRAMLNDKYTGNVEWFVRYQKNSSNVYYPVFYSANEIENAHYDDNTGASTSGIKAYVYGQDTETKEVKNKYARMEQDTSGRYISLVIYKTREDCEKNVGGIAYSLEVKTENDEAAYNDAMNQYYYDKSVYDQKIQEVNSKIEIIQVQDKNLELKLKQLDTERQALDTEIDAVKKVISKNVDTTFKTFSA